MTLARAVLDGAFRKCCMRSGGYDGSRRNYFFSRIEIDNSARGHSGPVRTATIGKRMYLRFVVTDIDEDSERALGVFHAVRYLRDGKKLYPYEEDQHDIVRWWFNENLQKPTRFTASKAPFYRKKSRALSWFKDTANEHLVRVRDLVAILDNHGVFVHTLKAKRVGYVVYEDEYQIVAEPFADMQC
jgi:hypothetical protein